MRFRVSLACGVFVVFLGVLLINNVSTKLTVEDDYYANLLVHETGFAETLRRGSKPLDFEEQVRAILAVQNVVLLSSPNPGGIALGKARELQDFYKARTKICYDRSRAIEKILAWVGFEVRHASIYSLKQHNFLEALITPKVSSHAMSEVLTSRGWMAVDSVERWIGLGRDRRPVALDEIDSVKGQLAEESTGNMHATLRAPHMIIRGLYSRHGYFYPPFVPIPDMNIPQLMANFW